LESLNGGNEDFIGAAKSLNSGHEVFSVTLEVCNCPNVDCFACFPGDFGSKTTIFRTIHTFQSGPEVFVAAVKAFQSAAGDFFVACDAYQTRD